MKKIRLLIVLPLLLILLLPVSVLAFEVKKGDIIYVGEDEVIEGNLYAAGTSITIDGKIEGDVYCVGQSVTINGEVAGDVMCAGPSVIINGNILGSVRVAGRTIIIKKEISQNLMAFGTNIALEKNAKVGWEMLAVGDIAEIRGDIGRDLYGGVEKMVISGNIGKDLRIANWSKDKDSLTIEDLAKINGDIVYTSFLKGSISDKAIILGEVTHNIPKTKYKKDTKWLAMNYGWGLIFSIFSTLVIGLVLISLWKKQIIELTNKLKEKAGASIGWGVLFMILTPIVALILMVTVIGLKLAFMLLGVWMILMCLGKIIVSILIGRSLVEKTFKKKNAHIMWSLVVGVAVTQIIFSIPVFGWILALIAIWWGLGGIFLYLKKT